MFLIYIISHNVPFQNLSQPDLTTSSTLNLTSYQGLAAPLGAVSQSSIPLDSSDLPPARSLSTLADGEEAAPVAITVSATKTTTPLALLSKASEVVNSPVINKNTVPYPTHFSDANSPSDNVSATIIFSMFSEEFFLSAASQFFICWNSLNFFTNVGI